MEDMDHEMAFEEVPQLAGAIVEILAAYLSIKDRIKMAKVCKKWREALLPSPDLWVLDTKYMLNNDPIDEVSLPDFRLFLSNRRHVWLKGLATNFDKPETLWELIDILNESVHNEIEEFSLIWGSESFSASPLNALNQVSNNLQDLSLVSISNDGIQIPTGGLTALTLLTRLDIGCRSIMFHKNCLCTSLRSLALGVAARGEKIFVEGLENLNLQNLTSLRMENTYGRVNDDHPTWSIFRPVWELPSLQELRVMNEVADELTWPWQVSQLTSLTYFSLRNLVGYSADTVRLSNLRNIRSFSLHCFPGNAMNRFPTGLFRLPLLSDVTLHGNGKLRLRYMNVTASDIWRIDSLNIELDAFMGYDFSLALSQEPRLQHLSILDTTRRPGGMPKNEDEVNLAVTNLLRFLAPLENFKSLTFTSSAYEPPLSGLLAQATVGKFVEFARLRPDVKMEF